MTLAITIFAAISCALAGNFLVLRKLSLLGDAMSHAVLPGIVIAFFAAGQTLDSPLFFIFAILTCLVLTLSIESITTHSRIKQDAAIGILFTFLFAVGVVMLVQFADNVHLDQDAVLYGQIELSEFDRLYIGKFDVGPRALWNLSVAIIINLLLIFATYKELKITTFDPAFARSVGISPKISHYLVVTMVSITIVAAFESVGAIIVLALLVVPPATAYLLANSLASMIALSTIFGALAASSGYFLALEVDGSIAGSVALMSGVILAICAIGQKLLQIRRQRKNVDAA